MYLTTKEPEEPTEKVDSIISSELGELNVEEISKLKSFLKILQGESCSLAQACVLILNSLLPHTMLGMSCES